MHHNEVGQQTCQRSPGSHQSEEDDGVHDVLRPQFLILNTPPTTRHVPNQYIALAQSPRRVKARVMSTLTVSATSSAFPSNRSIVFEIIVYCITLSVICQP